MSVSSPRLLYADGNRASMGSMLELMRDASANCPVTTVHDGNEALRLLDQEEFDLIVIDCWLPEITGFKLCRKIRENDDTVPVILVAEFSLNNDRTFAKSAGATAFFLKGKDTKELFDFVSSSLGTMNRQTSHS